ncbi:MAG: DMT family transporter [Pseudomonadota bacterium]
MTIAPRWAYAAVLLGVFGHASSEFFAVLSGVSGPEASVWRYLIGGFGLVLWALCYADSRDLLTPMRKDGLRITLLSIWGITITYLLFHWSLDYATVIQVATVVTTIPIFVALANWVVNGQRPGQVKIATGALATLGVVLLITDGAVEALAGDAGTLIGIAMAIGCAASGSFYSVIVKPVIAEHGAMRIIALSMMIGGVGLWLLVGAAWGIWVDPTTMFDRPAVAGWSLLILALWNTTITQLVWFGGLAAAPDITRASYLFFLKPVIAAALAILILAEFPSAFQVGAIVVVAGSVLVEMFWERLRPRRAA